ncbi:hypothetical protein BC835DRAFT_1418508 [Cytidiella melzeri]|nr:hypothetical protein BC835DRAFT_1418508 [Cytidiella melzeri]
MHGHQSCLLWAVLQYTVGMFSQQALGFQHEALRQWYNMINLPRVGHKENYYFNTFQLNLAAAQATDSQQTLADVMGEQFGGLHKGQGNGPYQPSSMTVLSDLPLDYDPGRLSLVVVGIFVELSPF